MGVQTDSNLDKEEFNMKKKVPAAVWVIITFVIFALLAWWAYMMLNHVRTDASGAFTITTQVAEGEGTVTPAKEKASNFRHTCIADTMCCRSTRVTTPRLRNALWLW